jgi:hypothetical protein
MALEALRSHNSTKTFIKKELLFIIEEELFSVKNGREKTDRGA